MTKKRKRKDRISKEEQDRRNQEALKNFNDKYKNYMSFKDVYLIVVIILFFVCLIGQYIYNKYSK